MQSVRVRLTRGSWYLNIRTFLVGPTGDSKAAALMSVISLFNTNSHEMCDAGIKINGPASYHYFLRFVSMRRRQWLFTVFPGAVHCAPDHSFA